MKYLWFLGLLLISTLTFADDDDEKCRYEFDFSSVVIEVLEDSQVIQQSIYVERDHTSPRNRCTNFRIFFSKGLANNYQRRAFTWFLSSITYNLHKQSNQSGVLKDFGDASNSNEYLEGTAPDRETTYTRPYFISVPGALNSGVHSGTYYDVVELRIYAFNQGQWRYEDSKNLTLVFYVPKTLQVSLIDEGGTFDASSTSKILDFGILSQNQEKGADLRVVSNGSYQVRLSSQNNGALKLSNGEGISYALKINNNNVSLAGSSSSPVLIGTGDATSTAGDLYNMKVKITESTQNKSAGLYQDVITITAIAN